MPIGSLQLSMMTSSNDSIFHVTGSLWGKSGGFPSQRPVTRALMFSVICASTNGWANNRDADDLRPHSAIKSGYEWTVTPHMQLWNTIMVSWIHLRYTHISKRSPWPTAGKEWWKGTPGFSASFYGSCAYFAKHLWIDNQNTMKITFGLILIKTMILLITNSHISRQIYCRGIWKFVTIVIVIHNKEIRIFNLWTHEIFVKWMPGVTSVIAWASS